MNLMVFLLCAATADAPPVAVTALRAWRWDTCLQTHTAETKPPSYTQSIPPPAVVRADTQCLTIVSIQNMWGQNGWDHFSQLERIVAGLLRWLFLSTENNTYFCNGCDFKFTDEDSLKDHMVQVHSDKPYKCDCCQAAFRYKGNLASHKTVHTGK